MTLQSLLEAPGQGLQPLLLQISQHKAFILQLSSTSKQQTSDDTNQLQEQAASGELPAALVTLNYIAVSASHHHLQELIVRLLQLAVSTKQITCTIEAAALALSAICWTAGSKDFRIGLLLQQPRSRELLQQASSSNHEVIRAAAASVYDRSHDYIMTAVLQADPLKVLHAATETPSQVLQWLVQHLQQHYSDVLKATQPQQSSGACSKPDAALNKAAHDAKEVLNRMAAAANQQQLSKLVKHLLQLASKRCHVCRHNSGKRCRAWHCYVPSCATAEGAALALSCMNAAGSRIHNNFKQAISEQANFGLLLNAFVGTNSTIRAAMTDVLFKLWHKLDAQTDVVAALPVYQRTLDVCLQLASTNQSPSRQLAASAAEVCWIASRCYPVSNLLEPFCEALMAPASGTDQWPEDVAENGNQQQMQQDQQQMDQPAQQDQQHMQQDQQQMGQPAQQGQQPIEDQHWGQMVNVGLPQQDQQQQLLLQLQQAQQQDVSPIQIFCLAAGCNISLTDIFEELPPLLHLWMSGDNLPEETAEAAAAALPAAAWLLHNLLVALSQHSTNPQLASAAFDALNRAVEYAGRTMLRPAMELLWKQQQAQHLQSRPSLVQLLRLCQAPVTDDFGDEKFSRAIALQVGLPNSFTYQHVWREVVNAAPQAVQEGLATALMQDLCSSSGGRTVSAGEGNTSTTCSSNRSDPSRDIAGTAKQQHKQASSSMYFVAHAVPASVVAQHSSQLLQILQGGHEYDLLVVGALLGKVWCNPELAQQPHISALLKQQLQAALQGSKPAWSIVSYVRQSAPGRDQLLLTVPHLLDDLATTPQPARQDQQHEEPQQQQQRPSVLLAYGVMSQLAQHGKHDALQRACSRLPLVAQQLLLGTPCFTAGQDTADVSMASTKEASEPTASSVAAEAGALLQCLLQGHVSDSEAHDTALRIVLEHFAQTAPDLMLDALLYQPSTKCVDTQHDVLLVDACILLKDNAADFIKLLADEASESQLQRLVSVLLQWAADSSLTSSSGELASSALRSDILWNLQVACIKLIRDSTSRHRMMQNILSEHQVQQLLLQILQYNSSRQSVCAVAYLLGQGLHKHSAEQPAVLTMQQLLDLVVQNNCTAAATVFDLYLFNNPVIQRLLLQHVDAILQALRQGHAGTSAWQLLADWSTTGEGAQAIAQRDWLFMLDVMMQQQSQVASSSSDTCTALAEQAAEATTLHSKSQQPLGASLVGSKADSPGLVAPNAAATVVANLAGTEAGQQLLAQEQHVEKLLAAASPQQHNTDQVSHLSTVHVEAMKAVRSLMQHEAGKAAVAHNMTPLLAVLQHQHSQKAACLAAEVLLQLVKSSEGLHALCSDAQYVAGIASLLNREWQPSEHDTNSYEEEEAGDVSLWAADIVAALAVTGPGRMRLSEQASFNELVRATQCPQLGVAEQALFALAQMFHAVDTNSTPDQQVEMQQQHTQEQQHQGGEQSAENPSTLRLDLQMWHVQLLGRAAQRPHLSYPALCCLRDIADSDNMEHKILLPVAFNELLDVAQLLQTMTRVEWGDTFVPDDNLELNLDSVLQVKQSARMGMLQIKHIAEVVRDVVHPELVLRSKAAWRELQEAIAGFASWSPVRCADNTGAKVLARGGQVAHQQALDALDSLIQSSATYQSLQLLLHYINSGS